MSFGSLLASFGWPGLLITVLPMPQKRALQKMQFDCIPVSHLIEAKTANGGGD
jgi:hypothetical protein